MKRRGKSSRSLERGHLAARTQPRDAQTRLGADFLVLDPADLTITGFTVHDIRFPTNESAAGTDAMNTECESFSLIFWVQSLTCASRLLFQATTPPPTSSSTPRTRTLRELA